MKVLPLSFVNLSHWPSNSARKFFNSSLLSLGVNTILFAWLKLAPSAKPPITGGIVSAINSKFPNMRNFALYHSPSFSALITWFFAPHDCLINIRSTLVSEIVLLGFIFTVKKSCAGIKPDNIVITSEYAVADSDFFAE